MENQWFYAKQGSEQKGPVSESEIRSLLSQGLLSGSDLVWREGLAAWVPLRTLPEFQASPPSSIQPPQQNQLVPVPSGLRGWMVFVGVVHIITGISTILSCVGLPIGIVQLIAGAALISGSSMLDRLPGVDPGMIPFLQKMRSFFLLTGVVALIGIALMALLIMAMIIGGAAVLTPMLEQLNHI